MRTSRSIVLASIVVLALLVSGAAILAQTETATAPVSSGSSFTDGRINGDIDLGGLAIYCTDQSGSTHTNTFQNGGIQVWGVGGNEYISLTADQLRGTAEIPQVMATMEAGATATMAAPVTVTEEATTMTGTEEAAATLMAPVVLARAAAPNGEVFFISFGDDNFALQGTDETGKSFSYFWTGCSQGAIQAGFQPLFTEEPGNNGSSPTEAATMEVTAMPPATAEATASS